MPRIGRKAGAGWRRDSDANDPLPRPALTHCPKARECAGAVQRQVGDNRRGPDKGFLWLVCSERTFFGGTIATADLGPIET